MAKSKTPKKSPRAAPSATTIQRARTEANIELIKKAFLSVLRETANVRLSTEKACVDRRTVYSWREKDEAFRAAWEDALEDAVDTLEESAWGRAKDGYEKPVYQQGELVGTVREYSDTLMCLLLKAHRPSRFRENVKVESTNTNTTKAVMPDMVTRIVVNRPVSEGGDAKPV